MKKMNKALLAAGFLLTSYAHAEVVIQSFNFTNLFETTEIAQTGSLSKFDSALGTLNSVTLALTGNSESTTSLANTAANSQTFSFVSDLNFFFTTNLNPTLAIPTPAFTTPLATTGGFTTLASGATLNLGTTTDSDSFSVILTDSAAIAAFLQTASMTNFNVECNTISGSSFSGGGGNITTNQVTTANCGATVTYEYTASTTPNPVPEPLLLWLMGAGLLGMAGVRRFS